MLTTKLKQQIRSSFEDAKKQLPNFSNRSSQNKMIAEQKKKGTKRRKPRKKPKTPKENPS